MKEKKEKKKEEKVMEENKRLKSDQNVCKGERKRMRDKIWRLSKTSKQEEAVHTCVRRTASNLQNCTDQ